MPEGRLLRPINLSICAVDSVALPELDFAMCNVTGESDGYRFLPHGTHFTEEGATVRLKYDRTRIPSGYTEDDIRTFYYDTEKSHWVALDRVRVNKELAYVESRTTHFTDMINGVIQAPESPDMYPKRNAAHPPCRTSPRTCRAGSSSACRRRTPFLPLPRR